MKTRTKLFTVLAGLMAIVFLAMMPTDTSNYGFNRIESNFDLSVIAGSDTTLYQKMPDKRSFDWSLEVIWRGVSGAGFVEVYVANNLGNWHAYDTITRYPNDSITGATGSYAFEHDMFAWRYLGIKITKGTLSAGSLDFHCNINQKK